MAGDKARAYIPLDLRGKKKIGDAIMMAIDDDVPDSASLNLQTDNLSIDVILDDEALEILGKRILAARLVLAHERGEKSGLKKGAESAKEEGKKKSE